MNTPGNALSVSKKITEKLRGGYKLALLSDMPTPALKKLKDQVCTSLGITDPNTIQLFDDLIIVGQQAGSAAPTKKPKRRKTKQIAVWL